MQAATFTVLNTNDSGSGSLRAAISSANANGPGLDNIYFNIPGAAVVHTITLGSQLPIITSTVNIDGTSQPGYAGLPLIEINGNSSAADGLSFSGSGNNTIKAVVINSCSSNGIYISGGSGSNTIQGCFIGTDAAGTVPAINGANGISIVNNGNNQIGGTVANDGNIVSCNLGNGISLLGSSCSSNTVEGNFLGTNPSGIALGNSLNGLRVINGSNNVIGGVASVNSNVIAFNAGNGVLIYATSGTTINNAIIFNSIYQNADTGIDLGNDGITSNDLNDPDGGANDMQNWPVIELITDDGIDTQISGTLNSTSGHDFRIDIYRNGMGYFDASHGEGYEHLTNTTITTDGTGNAVFLVTLTGVVLDKLDRISATATRTVSGSFKGTSEFGLNWVFEQAYCKDGIDNDGDGMIDCEDPDCSEYDWDNDLVCDKYDLDDDNDGILDADEQSCDSSSPLAAWWHNSGVTGTNLNGSYVLAISDEVIGAGLHSPDYSFTRLAVSGADEVTLDGAMLSNDYLEYVLQTLPALPTDLFLNQIGQYLHFSPGMMDYKIAVYVSDDDWVTKQLLFLNEVATQGVGATLVDVRSHYYQLKANRIYRYRVYLYDAPLVNTGNVTYDDFQIVACASNMDADNDLVLDHLDLDSDNDGIYDVIEAGGTDGDGDGVIGVGPITDTDLDGWSDISDSDNGGTALTDPDTDGDGNENRIDSDSDADGCSDTIEAGFPDSDGDGQLGGLVPPTVNASGTVTSGGI